jgi:hypothetical protein
MSPTRTVFPKGLAWGRDRPVAASVAVLAAGCIVSVAALAWAAGPARAVEPPDSARLLELKAACDTAWQVRLVGRRAVFATKRPSLDAGGITLMRSSGPPALLTVGHFREPARRIPWAEIERVQSERPSALRGATMGLFVGMGLAVVMRASIGPDLFERGDNGSIWFAGALVLGFTGIGFLVGASNPTVHTLYP